MDAVSDEEAHSSSTIAIQPMHIDDNIRDGQALPRVDGGKDAWTVLAGCFVLEALVWGFPYSFGVFQNYYSTHEPFDRQPSGIAAISTTASGIMFIASPLVAVLIQRFPRSRRLANFVGLAILTIALVAASFTNTTGALLATQGILFAIGGLTMYFPAMYVIDEWFIARKGLAFAVIWTGTGVGGAIFPFVSQWLLDSYGFRTTLRVWAVVIFVLAFPSILATKNRLPASNSSTLRPLNLAFMKLAPFWIYSFGNMMQSIAYFLPQLWIPSFAREIGLPPLALCLLNLAACGGYISQGIIVDRYHVTVAICVATLGSVLAIFVFWGLTTSQAMLYVFVILWGLTGGGFSANWAGCAAAIRNSGYHVDTGMVISLLCVSKGVGSVVSGPISERLLRVALWDDAGFAYGTRYGVVIVFTGVSATLGGAACVGRLAKMV
ncbi:hypothetical protein Q7P37_005906 [Cladosporium fusiforme]